MVVIVGGSKCLLHFLVLVSAPQRVGFGKPLLMCVPDVPRRCIQRRIQMERAGFDGSEIEPR